MVYHNSFSLVASDNLLQFIIHNSFYLALTLQSVYIIVNIQTLKIEK